MPTISLVTWRQSLVISLVIHVVCLLILNLELILAIVRYEEKHYMCFLSVMANRAIVQCPVCVLVCTVHYVSNVRYALIRKIMDVDLSHFIVISTVIVTFHLQ